MSKNKLATLVALLMALTFVASACTTDSSEETTTGDDTGTTEADDTGTTEADDTSDTADAGGDAAMGDASCAEGTINISGSSTVEPISSRAAELYEDNCGNNISITVDGPGTGDGFKVFCAGETDISDASRQIKDSEAEDCAANGVEYTELKVAFDGISVLTSPANEIACMSFADLYAQLGGESEGFENWSDGQTIASELGSSTEFPDAPLTISAPGTESGTYDSFIEIVLEKIAEERQGDGAQAIRTDFAGNADDNVIIEGLAGADTSLGWVGFAFAEANQDRVREIPISAEPDGDCVEPTVETIADGSYPVSRGLYIYVNNEKIQSNPAVAGYVDYYLGDAYTEAVTKSFGDSGYVALPDDQKSATDDAWAAAKG